MRLLLALAVGALMSTLGALIVGEYELKGVTPIIAGILFGLVLAEVLTSVARRRDTLVIAASAALAAGGLVWAAWISSGEDWSYVPTMAWVGVGLSVVAAYVWIRTPGRRGAGTRPGT